MGGGRVSVRGGIRARTYLASGVLALLVGGSFTVLLASIAELRRSAALEQHSQQVLVATNRVERLVVDLETGLRGFLITGSPRFLEPWEEARAAIPQQTSTLGSLAQVPEQHARAERLTTSIAAYIDDYAVPLLAVARRDLDAARSTARLAEGKRRLDRIRADFDRLEAAERRLSATRHAAAEAAARRAILSAVGGIVGSILLVSIFSAYVGRLIVRPIRQVAATAGRIAEGDLGARAPETGVDEIGLLGRSFNEMAASVQSSQTALAEIADEQSALRRVATLVARGVPSPEVFRAVTEEVGKLLGADLSHMVRFETDGTVSGVAGWSRGGDPIPVGAHVSLDGESVSASVLRTGHASRMDSYADAPGPIAHALRSMGVRSSVGSPMVVDGRRWGAMIASSKGEALPPDAESRLTAFTELAATAISNAYASAELAASRARIVAAADDARRRIERDLHDGAQQRIVSLGLELRAAELAVPPELTELQKQVADVADGLESLLEELRELSRGIHPAILSQGGLAAALRALGRRSPIPVEVDVRTDARYSEHVEVTAYYVASEALANAAKHADAAGATLVLESNGHRLRLVIRDDGSGGADPALGSGLIGLRDRVEALGGTIEISSPIGGGTSLTVELPGSEGPVGR